MIGLGFKPSFPSSKLKSLSATLNFVLPLRSLKWEIILSEKEKKEKSNLDTYKDMACARPGEMSLDTVVN